MGSRLCALDSAISASSLAEDFLLYSMDHSANVNTDIAFMCRMTVELPNGVTVAPHFF